MTITDSLKDKQLVLAYNSTDLILYENGGKHGGPQEDMGLKM